MSWGFDDRRVLVSREGHVKNSSRRDFELKGVFYANEEAEFERNFIFWFFYL